MKPLAVYIHVPFCPSKCGYCDFNSYAMNGEIIERTSRAIVSEIRNSPHKGRPAKTIFFGGGTPTFIPVNQLLSIYDEVIKTHPPLENCEITSEANPGTVDREKFACMRKAGFNRISIGGQSFDKNDLIRLERIHESDDISRAVGGAKDAGFENINLDLMFALPHQTMKAWESNLRKAIELQTQHLSLYNLTIEPNTKFYRLHLRGQLQLPPESLQAEMYEKTLDMMNESGFHHYEISNFAKPGFECKHNLCYWHGEEYAGYGPGAVEQIYNIRSTNIKHPIRYCEAVENHLDLSCEKEILTEKEIRIEEIMLGLRLDKGISISSARPNEQKLEQIIRGGYAQRDDGRIKLTRKGKLFCNTVVLELI